MYNPDEQRIAMRIRRDAEALGWIAMKNRVRRQYAIGYGQWTITDGHVNLFSGDLEQTAEFMTDAVSDVS
jgi:hypothetical protein